MHLLCRRELLSKVGKFYLDLDSYVINLLPDDCIPDDNELRYIMTPAEMTNDSVMADKSHQVIIDRCLGEKLEECIEIIRASDILDRRGLKGIHEFYPPQVFHR